MAENEDNVEWPEPQDDPAEEPAESLENDGTPGAAPPDNVNRGEN